MIKTAGTYQPFSSKANFICYFFGKWLGLSPEKAADRAINKIRVITAAGG
jgi:hypothetical protein